MSHRIVNKLSDHAESNGDAAMMEQLMLYKTPATIRDMKQVFFYVSTFANTLSENPLDIFTNKGRNYVSASDPTQTEVLYNVAPYYAPIGTKRQFNIWNQVSHLLDVRVPKDKYFLEISLVEAQIDADPSAWVQQRNLVGIATGTANDYDVYRTYNI